MDKSILTTLVFTPEQLKKVRSKAASKALPINKALSMALENWYKDTKDVIKVTKNEHEVNFVKCRFDEDTIKLYSLFIENAMNELINYMEED